ncbi:uncharacterized protein LOC141594904 [Silene latifolia]|uniref:uncharacterized protein LOC141594904 n=1 Tax=Silene latifolia TaxID=37657 RepID=UPI003D779665
MGNLEWIEEFGDYWAHFHPPGLFDHSPCTLSNMKSGLQGKKCFKYFNMWGQSEIFKVSVDDVWQRQIRGTKMFQVIKKLKALKPVLKNINKSCFSDIENSYNITVVLLESIQKDMVDNPGNTDLMQQEYDVANELKELLAARDSFFIQKAKLQWSLEGDINTGYFHNSIRKRMVQNKVLSIEDQNGNI